MPLSTIFQSVYWWRKPEYPEKTTDLSDFIIPKLKTKWKIKQNFVGTLLTYSLTLQYSKHVRIHYFATSTNKLTEILLKVALNTITLTLEKG
jgi:hypothetical protein